MVAILCPPTSSIGRWNVRKQSPTLLHPRLSETLNRNIKQCESKNHLQINLWEIQWLRGVPTDHTGIASSNPICGTAVNSDQSPEDSRASPWLQRVSPHVLMENSAMSESDMMKTRNEHQYASGYWQLTVKSTRSRHEVIRWNGDTVPLTPNLKVRDEWPASHSGRFISKKTAPAAYCIER